MNEYRIKAITMQPGKHEFIKYVPQVLVHKSWIYGDIWEDITNESYTIMDNIMDEIKRHLFKSITKIEIIRIEEDIENG